MNADSSVHALPSPRAARKSKRLGAAVAASPGLWIGAICAAAVVVGLALFAHRASRRSTTSTEAFGEQAQRDLREGRYPQVERALQRAARAGTATPVYWFVRGELADARNQPDQAIEALARIPGNHALAAQARLLTGQIERKRNRVRFAEIAFLAALAIDPSLVQAHRELIYIYGMQLRRPELSREFLALKKANAFTFKNAFHWCLLRNNSWEPREAITELLAYVAADPLDRWSRLALAENYRRMGLDGEAESVLSSLSPDDNEANTLRIQIALDRHDNERADELLALAPPDDPVVARVRGRRALARRDGRSAVRHFQLAYAADPSNRDTIFGLISAWELLGNQKEAAPLRALARNLDRLNTLVLQAAKPDAPGNTALMKQLGATCAALHRNEEARAWFELAIARDPLDSSAQQALFRLNAPGEGGRKAGAKSPEPPPGHEPSIKW
jgi:hypothetical protein